MPMYLCISVFLVLLSDSKCVPSIVADLVPQETFPVSPTHPTGDEVFLACLLHIHLFCNNQRLYLQLIMNIYICEKCRRTTVIQMRWMKIVSCESRWLVDYFKREKQFAVLLICLVQLYYCGLWSWVMTSCGLWYSGHDVLRLVGLLVFWSCEMWWCEQWTYLCWLLASCGLVGICHVMMWTMDLFVLLSNLCCSYVRL
jgi:hypothetical protein